MSVRVPSDRAFEDLAWAAQNGGPGLARATLKVQTELFVQNQGSDDGAFLPLALKLLPMVDEETARDVARKVGPLALTPPSLVVALFERGGGVAEAVIEHSESLPVHLRREALEHSDPRIPVKLAGRDDLTEAEQVGLMERGEPVVLAAMARNHAVPLCRAVTTGLIAAARQDAVLADLLLVRPDLDPVALVSLYAQAPSGPRGMIRQAIQRRVLERKINLPVRKLAEDAPRRLLDTSLEGIPALIAELALVSGRGEDFVMAAARDASREVVALSLVGLSLEPEETTRILLRTGDPVARDSRALHRLVDIVRTTERVTAETIIAANWPSQTANGQSGRAAPQHIPAMAPGGNSSRGTQGATRKPGAQDILEQVRGRR